MKKYRFKIAGREMEAGIGEKVVAHLPIEVKGINIEARTLTAVVSTEDPDRHCDSVIQGGWDLKNYIKNSVILDSHNYQSVTDIIGKALRTEVVTKGKKTVLEQDIQFAVDENPKAKIIFDLYAGGYAKAFSVGFIVKEFGEVDGKTDWWTITKAELLEVSAVSVPANALALAKSKGIHVELLDTPTTKSLKEDCEDCRELAEGEVTEGHDHEVEIEEEADEPEETPADPEPEAPAEDPAPEPEPETVPEEIPAVDPEADPEPEPEAPVVVASLRTRSLKVILGIDSKKRKELERAASIIKGMLAEDPNATAHLSTETQRAIHNRKVNKAVRAILGVKE